MTTHMPTERTSREPGDEDVPIPALLRAARGAYGHAIRLALSNVGIEDMPRNGPFLLGGMANHGQPAGDLLRELGITRQAASQLADTLVLRGYLEREPDPDDRRRIRLTVTERGRGAAAAVRAAVNDVDAELSERLPPEQLAGLRAGLEALCDIRDAMEFGVS